MRTKDELPYIEWTDTTGQVHRMYADAVLQEPATFPATVTQFPIDTGSPATDHIVLGPIAVHLELFFSEQPVRGDLIEGNAGTIRSVSLAINPAPTPGGILAVTGAVEGLLGLGASDPPDHVDVLQFRAAPNRAAELHAFILAVRADGLLLTVATNIAVYEQMSITNAQLQADPDGRDGTALSLDLQQLTFTQSDVVTAIELPVEPRAQKKKNSNAGSTKDAASGGSTESVAHNLVGKAKAALSAL